MKVICDCGAKYAFDATPEMVRNPLTFACPACGVDLSPRIQELVLQQFGPAIGPVGLSVSPTALTPPSGLLQRWKLLRRRRERRSLLPR
ncbi:MAG: hypothetical protein QM813_02130 [Verrucomicrobiota bacterium]